MGRKVIDLTGQSFGIMRVIGRDHTSGGGKGVSSKWLVLCGCGTEKVLSSNVLRTLHQQSCGCMRGIGGRFEAVHGIPKAALQRWTNMMRRCYKPASVKDRRNYCNRGIAVCQEWHDPKNFYADMGDPPFDGATIDRINNDGNYEPSNCRWANYSVQNKNRRPFVMGVRH